MSCVCPTCRMESWSLPAPSSLLSISARTLVTALTSRAVQVLGAWQSTACRGPTTMVCSKGRSCPCKMADKMKNMVRVLAVYLHEYLPGGPISRDMRHLLLEKLSKAPVDPRVPGGREVVWCSLISEDVENLIIEGAGLSRYIPGTGHINTYTAVGADVILMVKGVETVKKSKLKYFTISNIEHAAVEPITKMLLGPHRFEHLVQLCVASTDYSAFTYRSKHAAAKYAYEQANMVRAISFLPVLEQLELSQPAVTPDLILLRLFYKDLVHYFPDIADHDLVALNADQYLINIEAGREIAATETPGFLTSQMSNMFLDPPSFRTLYDGAAPVIFPSGPITLQQLLPYAIEAPVTPLSENLISLTVRGHSLPLLSPPLALLACKKLKTFSMHGHAYGSSRHYTLSSINNIQHNFLIPAVAMLWNSGYLKQDHQPASNISNVSILDPFSGESVATYDLFSVDVTRQNLLEISTQILTDVFPNLSKLTIQSHTAIADPQYFECLRNLRNLTQLTIDHIRPAAILPLLSHIGTNLTHLQLSRTATGLDEILKRCSNLIKLVHFTTSSTTNLKCLSGDLKPLTHLETTTNLDLLGFQHLLLSAPNLEYLSVGPKDSNPRPRNDTFHILPSHFLQTLQNRTKPLRLHKLDISSMFMDHASIPENFVGSIFSKVLSLRSIHVQNKRFSRQGDMYIEHRTKRWMQISE